jgi:hypothetical protein
MGIRAFKFFMIPPDERKLFLQSLRLLIYWKLVTIFLPMRIYRVWLGREQEESNAERLYPLPYIQSFIRSMKRAIRILPFKPKCLTEAIAAKQLLQKHGITSTLYLGVAKKGNSSIIAHAWLRCGENIITGRKGMNKFTVVAFFT